MDYKVIEDKVGYSFKDKALLDRAFTHKSFSSNPTSHYEALEFLGDAIIQLVVSEELLKQNPCFTEGKLTSARAAFVMKGSLAKLTDKLDLVKYMQLGKGESKEKIQNDDKRKCDLFESIVAAIYLDSASLDVAKKFILNNINLDLTNLKEIKHSNPTDYKSELNRVYPGPKHTVEYRLDSEEIIDNKHQFKVTILIDGKEAGTGIASTIKMAEGKAAKYALNK